MKSIVRFVLNKEERLFFLFYLSPLQHIGVNIVTVRKHGGLFFFFFLLLLFYIKDKGRSRCFFPSQLNRKIEVDRSPFLPRDSFCSFSRARKFIELINRFFEINFTQRCCSITELFKLIPKRNSINFHFLNLNLSLPLH